jgi:hypothetical protein
MGAPASSIVQSMPRTAGLQGLRFDVGAAGRVVLLAALLAAALGSAWDASNAAADQALQRAAAAQRPSIVLVVACRPNGELTDCRSSTAFSVAPGVFLTAGHALLGSDQVTISSATRGTAVAFLDRGDTGTDVALLRSSLALPTVHTAAHATPGQRAIVVCSRRAITADGLTGRSATYVGTVGGAPIRVEQGDHELLLERVAGAASVLGCSGSPVLDEDGDLLGVLVGGDGGSAGIIDVSQLQPVIAGR